MLFMAVATVEIHAHQKDRLSTDPLHLAWLQKIVVLVATRNMDTQAVPKQKLN
jgi:hypothetical protein